MTNSYFLRKVSYEFKIVKMVLLVFLVCPMYSIFLFDIQSMQELTREDGVIETFGAIMFLVSSVVFGLAYFRSSCSQNGHVGQIGLARKNIFYLLLSLLFLLAFLEEISWGQRIFGIETPTVIAKVNRQKEINIHNLEWFHGHDKSGNRKRFLMLFLNGDRLFSIFWFVYCVCIPLLEKYNQRMKKVFAKIRLPVIPLQYAFLFPLNYVASKALEAIYPIPIYEHGIVETKETVSAILFVCVALGQVYRLSKWPNVVCARLRSTS